MRFGRQLKTSLIRDYEHFYIAYDHLKASLKTPFQAQPTTEQDSGLPPRRRRRRSWNEDDERRFVRQLEQELDKVFTFQNVKSDDISRRIAASDKEVYDVINRQQQHQQQASDSGHSTFVDAPTEEDFLILEEDLSDVIADVHDLAKFTQLNYTGFQKIIKKHDKMTSWHLKPVFATRLSAKPFWKDNYDALIVKLSRLYDLVRNKGRPTKGNSASGGAQQNFVRQTTKYWVHPDNITELKLIILKHLPVLVFNPSKEFEPKDSAISSIYFDNPNTWELYTGRLKKTEGAEAIRLRWYGGMDTDTIFVERKTHREDWTGEKSVKARFSLKEKNVNDFLAGNLAASQVFAKMRKEGKKSEKEIADLEQLAKEVQYRVLTRKLKPVTRSFYNRTAFQLPGDARVRISLDTELTMTREDNLDGVKRAGKDWRRMDIGIDFPFCQLPPEDVERFPYAVLEVKLQTQAGSEPPQWIRDLCASHLVEAVPKYSKFIHGTAILNPTRIHLLPFWLPQMDADIRKPVSHRFGIEHPNQSTEASTSANLDDEESDEEDELAMKQPSDESRPGSDNSNENIKRLRAARDAMERHEQDLRRDDYVDHPTANDTDNPNAMDIEERVAAAQPTYGAEYAEDSDEEMYYESDDNLDLETAKQLGGWPYYRTLIQHHVHLVNAYTARFLRTLLPIPRATSLPTPQSTMGVPRVGARRKVKAPPGKRIHVPVRVEPKVFFAAERTFLSWLEFCIILGSIAATLLNFGDDVALKAAGAFTVVSVLALGYAMGLYVWRVEKVRRRRAVTYHDRFGPTVLTLALVAAVGMSCGLRLKGGGDGAFEGGLRGR